MSSPFEVKGQNAAAPFTLKVNRGEGMVLLAMNWRQGQPPADFVGFAIEYREPQAQEYYTTLSHPVFSLDALPVPPREDGQVHLSRHRQHRLGVRHHAAGSRLERLSRSISARSSALSARSGSFLRRLISEPPSRLRNSRGPQHTPVPLLMAIFVTADPLVGHLAIEEG
jgi:hypothetical protein